MTRVKARIFCHLEKTNASRGMVGKQSEIFVHEQITYFSAQPSVPKSRSVKQNRQTPAEPKYGETKIPLQR